MKELADQACTIAVRSIQESLDFYAVAMREAERHPNYVRASDERKTGVLKFTKEEFYSFLDEEMQLLDGRGLNPHSEAEVRNAMWAIWYEYPDGIPLNREEGLTAARDELCSRIGIIAQANEAELRQIWVGLIGVLGSSITISADAVAFAVNPILGVASAVVAAVAAGYSVSEIVDSVFGQREG